MSSLRSITQSNRDSWNQIHSARPGRPPSFFASGGSVLEDFEIELAGDVTGKRVLQLACSCGDEALSWASRGADVTGIDISEVAIDLAREKSMSTGIAVDFRRADIFDLPADLTGFDLVYCSWGAICWVPDLTVFAGIVAGRLRPGRLHPSRRAPSRLGDPRCPRQRPPHRPRRLLQPYDAAC